jgi:hypothetical protein
MQLVDKQLPPAVLSILNRTSHVEKEAEEEEEELT